MVYTNIVFDLPGLFYALPISPVKIPFAKKVKKSDIYAPYGGIFSVQKRTETRGVDTRPKTAKEKKVVSRKKKNIEHFLNQISIILSLEHHHIHMMMFGDNIKIAGCKNDEDAILSISILFKKYLKPLSEQKGKPFYSLKEGHEKPLFIFDTVMRNVDFSLNFDINREKVNNVFNNILYRDKIFMSQFETTEHKSVNMKKYAIRPEDFTYTCYSPEDDDLTKTDRIFTKRSDYEMYDSFLIFSSSKVILSGKYDQDLEDGYNFFIETMLKHRKDIEEVIEPVTEEEKDKFRALMSSKP